LRTDESVRIKKVAVTVLAGLKTLNANEKTGFEAVEQQMIRIS
jgi:hypothetical protein